MKIFTIIGGVNGVGKSSLTGVLAARSNDLGVIIDTDRITAESGGNKIKGGHYIPDVDVQRRYNKRFDDLSAVLPYCNKTHFFDNENGFIKKAEYKNGKIIMCDNAPPEWLTILISAPLFTE